MSSWESDPLVFACNAQGDLVHVDTVPNGAACACTCPSCKQPLVAKNGGTKLVHHFAHQKGACKWAAETAVIMLIRGFLESAGTMFVKAASYRDLLRGKKPYFSPFGRLSILEVSPLEVDGRQSCALKVSCLDESGTRCEFALVVALAKQLSDEQIEQLSRECGNVLAIDFKSAYANMRETEGQHFNRSEFFLRVQDPNYLASILMEDGGSELLRWQAHPQRDKAAAEAHERYRQKLDEDRKALMARLGLPFDEEDRLRAEAEREQAIEAERRAFEEEGVETLPKVRMAGGFFIEHCPLLSWANVDTDCGAGAQPSERCIFFEGQRRYLIGCTAHQNGIGI